MQAIAELYNRIIRKVFRSGFIKNIFIYSSGALFLKGVSFFLIPLYTAILAPSDFGVLELLTTISTVLGILFSFGLSQVIYVEYFHLPPDGKRDIIKQLTSIYTFIALPLFAIAGLLIYYNSDTLFEQRVEPVLIILVLLYSFFTFYQNTFFALLQLVKKALNLTVNKLVLGLLTLALNLFLVLYLRMGIAGILITNLVVVVVSLLYPLYLYLYRFGLKATSPNPSGMVKYLKMGVPFIFSSLCFWGLSGIDRWLILYLLGEAEVGIFSVAYKFSSVFDPLVIAPILSVYTPYIFEKLAERKYKQNKLLMVLGVLLLFAFLAVASQLLARYFINERYFDSLSLIPYLVGGFAFYFLSQLLAAPILFFKRSNLLLTNVALAALVNIIFNVIFIRLYGLQGAGMAYLLSNIAWFAMSAIQNASVINTAQKNQ